MHLLIWSAYDLQKNFNNLKRKQLLVTNTSDKNIHEHAVNLRLNWTNHKKKKFPERFEICLFSLQ